MEIDKARRNECTSPSAPQPTGSLTCALTCARIKTSGETGANPVRARRRETHEKWNLSRMPQVGDKPLEESEKADFYCVESKYPDKSSLFVGDRTESSRWKRPGSELSIGTASAGEKRKTLPVEECPQQKNMQWDAHPVKIPLKKSKENKQNADET